VPTYESEDEADRVFAVITERDPFRLIIRGHALIEDVLDAGINSAFTGGTPRELKRIAFSARVALARALELITPELSDAILAVAAVRHEFAHGRHDEFTDDHVASVGRAVVPLLCDDVDLGAFSLGDAMRIAIAAVHEATAGTVEEAMTRRDEAALALIAWRKDRALSRDQITKLLAADSGGANEAAGVRASSQAAEAGSGTEHAVVERRDQSG
jgi:hypothetical protein